MTFLVLAGLVVFFTIVVAVAVHCQRDAALLPDFDDHDLRDCTRHRGELEALGRATRQRPEPDWYRQDEGVRW